MQLLIINDAAWLESIKNTVCVPTLLCRRDTLTKESCRTRFMCQCRDSTTDFVDEFESLPSPDARRFDSHWHEVNAWDDIVVLQGFVDSNCFSGRASFVAACYHVTRCEWVWARSVPSQALTSSPWKLRHAVGRLPVFVHRPCGSVGNFVLGISMNRYIITELVVCSYNISYIYELSIYIFGLIYLYYYNS